jgi:hypothetical protein
MLRNIALGALVAMDEDGAETFDVAALRCGAGRNNLRAERSCDLDCDVSDAPGATVDQDLLIRRHAGPVDQPFPGRDDDERQGRGFTHPQSSRLDGQQVLIDRSEFRQRPWNAADPAGHAINLISRMETGHIGSHGFDHSSQIDAKDRGQWVTRMGRHTRMDLGVERVDGTRKDTTNEHLAAADRGERNPGDPKRRAILFENRRPHLRSCHDDHLHSVASYR